MRPWTFWLMAVLVTVAAVSLGLWLLVSLGYFAARGQASVFPPGNVSTSNESTDNPAHGRQTVSLSPEQVQRLGIRVRKLVAAVGQVEAVAYGTLQEDISRIITLRAPCPGILRTVEDARWPGVGDVLPPGSVIGLLEPRAETQPASASAVPEDSFVPGNVLQLKLEVESRVLDVVTQPGQSVENGQIILRLVRHDQLLAQVKLPAGEALPESVTVARMTISGHESWPLMGRYVSLKDAPDKSRVLVFAVPTMGYPLQAGMMVAANIPVGRRNRAGVDLPEASVFDVDGKSWVWVQRGEGVYQRRLVRLGAPTTQGWFVADALQPGEMVVVQGKRSLLALELQSQSDPGP